MKRVIVLCLAVLLLLTACSSKKSKTKWPMSEQHEKYGRRALEITDAYLDFEITAKEAHERLGELKAAEDTLPEDASEDEHLGNFLIVSSVSNLYHHFFFVSYGRKPASDILEMRNSLAELLGEKER